MPCTGKSVLHSAGGEPVFFIGLPLKRPRLLIPVASAGIQAAVFDLYSPGSTNGKLFKWAGKAVAGTGLLKLAGALIARPAGAFEAGREIRPILNDAVIAALEKDWKKSTGKGRLALGLSLGDPNPYRKITALLFDRDRTPLAIAKIGCTSSARRLIENERIGIEKMGATGLKDVSIPSLLGHGRTGPTDWILQQALLAGKPSSCVLSTQHINILASLTSAAAQMVPLASCEIWMKIRQWIDGPEGRIKTGFEPERDFIAALAKQAVQNGDQNASWLWPLVAAHGDFAPWNMRLAGGTIALFDWEYFLPLAPAGWDLLHFIFRVENLISRKSLEQIWAAFEAGAYRESLSAFERKSGLTIPDWRFVAMLVLLNTALDLIPRWICRGSLD